MNCYAALAQISPALEEPDGHTRDGPNSSSNLDPKHYHETLARIGTEADDAGYDEVQQSRLPSDQVLTGAGPETLHEPTPGRRAEQASPVAA